jgi:hypothetical protein
LISGSRENYAKRFPDGLCTFKCFVQSGPRANYVVQGFSFYLLVAPEFRFDLFDDLVRDQTDMAILQERNRASIPAAINPVFDMH